jgi:hypothetical protein
MKLTKRGKRVRAVLILALVVGIYLISTRLWWVDGGYCIGDLIACNS